MAYQTVTDPAYDNMPTQALSTCLRCGAVVADEDQHDEFHDELDS